MPDQNTTTDPNQDQTNNQQNETFGSWLEKQDEAVRRLYTEHTTGLQNTVKATRQERDDLAKQIKDLSSKAEKGSEMEKSLTEMSAKLEQAERRVLFAEEAVMPEIGCSNPKAAFALAVTDDLFKRDGSPDWVAIKAAAPELFGKSKVKSNAGDGTDTEPAAARDMNKFIRRASGRE